MSDDSEELDHELRRRLSGLLETAQPLDDAARARTVRALQAEAARMTRRQRTRRAAIAVAAALAAAFAAVVLPRLDAAPAERTSPAVAALPPRCGLPTDRAALQFQRSDAQQQLELAGFGRLTAEASAQVRVARATVCELELELTHGMLAGALHDLRPARLIVRTPYGAVHVRGTTFSVRSEGELEVVLLSGAVDVIAAEEVTRLRPGQTLRKRAPSARARIAPSSRDQETAVDTLLREEAPTAVAQTAPPVRAASPAVQAASPDPTRAPDANPAGVRRDRGREAVAPELRSSTLLGAAEAARRAGDIERARALYADAGALPDLDAEVAILRWARLELELGDARAAQELVTRHRRQFPRPRLEAEARWLELRALARAGRIDDARVIAGEMQRRFADSPQARAAKTWLEEH